MNGLKEDDFVKKDFSDSKFVQAVMTLKDVVSLYKYMTDSHVESILVDQSKRVAKTLGQVEKDMEKLDFSKSKRVKGKYIAQDLEAEWNKWIKLHAKETMDMINDFWVLKDKYKEARERLEKDKKKLDEKDKNYATKNAKYDTLIKTLKNGEDEVAKIQNKAWKNPFA